MTPRSAGKQLERLVENLGQQRLQIEDAHDRLTQLVGDAQLFVVALQRIDGQILGRHKPLGPVRIHLVTDVAVVERAVGNRDPLERVLVGPALGVHHARVAHRDLVVVLEDLLGDADVADVASVERAQVLQHKAAVGLANDVGVFLRDNSIEDLDRVLRMTPNRIELAKFKFFPATAGKHDQLGQVIRSEEFILRAKPVLCHHLRDLTPTTGKRPEGRALGGAVGHSLGAEAEAVSVRLVRAAPPPEPNPLRSSRTAPASATHPRQ